MAFSWPAAARERAKQLYLVEGHSARMVAEALSSEFKHSISRSAVIGMLNRMRVKREADARPKVRQEQAAPKRKAAVRKRQARPMIDELKAPRASPKGSDKKGATRPAYSTLTGMRIGVATRRGYVPAEPAAADPLNLTLMQLEAGSCRWPVSASAPFLFCGHVAEPGGPYCPDHMAARRPRDAAAEARRIDAYAEAFGGGA